MGFNGFCGSIVDTAARISADGIGVCVCVCHGRSNCDAPRKKERAHAKSQQQQQETTKTSNKDNDGRFCKSYGAHSNDETNLLHKQASPALEATWKQPLNPKP